MRVRRLALCPQMGVGSLTVYALALCNQLSVAAISFYDLVSSATRSTDGA